MLDRIEGERHTALTPARLPVTQVQVEAEKGLEMCGKAKGVCSLAASVSPGPVNRRDKMIHQLEEHTLEPPAKKRQPVNLDIVLSDVYAGSCRNLELSNFENSWVLAPLTSAPMVGTMWKAQRLHLKAKRPTGRTSADVGTPAIARIPLHRAIASMSAVSKGATLATTLRMSTRRVFIVHDPCYDGRPKMDLRYRHRQLVRVDRQDDLLRNLHYSPSITIPPLF
ncbi:hypothetical protein EDB19DRAFT_1828918 [Suillus lakei]|nr:hypothetical protein EDB19DRAFT_1828918 [Suillus lakei]